jgi:hypothetical protein
MSNAFLALIWWVVPAAGLIGALGYVLWLTKFQSKFQHETKRSVDRFQLFQDTLRDTQAREVNTTNNSISTELPKLFNQEDFQDESFIADNDSQPKPPQL